MSTHMCRSLVLALRWACCHPHSKTCMRQAVLAPRGTCWQARGLCVPGATQPPSRAYSLDSLSCGPGRPPLVTPSQQPRAEKSSPSSALTHRRLSARAVQGQRRPLCYYDFLNIGKVEANLAKVWETGIKKRIFLVDSALASLVTQHLGPDVDHPKTTIFEINPGPGVLTRTLLNAGAQRVVALESSKSFLPDLQDLERQLEGQLEVIHCDYFKLDPFGQGIIRPPTMLTEKLFTDLGISEASWTDDVPVKVVGIVPHWRERSYLLKAVYTLYEGQALFRYGRVELNLFISEKEYAKMVARPGDMQNYTVFSVLWQMACDIQLLHTEPWASFVTLSRKSLPKTRLPNDNMCLVRLTPREDLFSTGLTTSNTSTMMVMLKQCLARRRGRLFDKLNQWFPHSASRVLEEMELREDVLTGHVYPDEYRRLYELLSQRPDFKQSWLLGEVMENDMRAGWVT